ncbi:MAG: PKD domain-containing protein [Thermoplasmata archaeon]
MKKRALTIVIIILLCSGIASAVAIREFTKGSGYSLKAKITSSTYEALVEENITFDGTNSTGDIIEWLWDFGDGDPSNEPIVTHSFDVSRYHNVYLNVRDKENNTDIGMITVKIKNIDFHFEYSADMVSTPLRTVIIGGNAISFPVLEGATNATVFANWTVQSNYAQVTLFVWDDEWEPLYEEDFEVRGTLENQVVLQEFKNYGEGYVMGIFCDIGRVEYTLEVSVRY